MTYWHEADVDAIYEERLARSDLDDSTWAPGEPEEWQEDDRETEPSAVDSAAEQWAEDAKTLPDVALNAVHDALAIIDALVRGVYEDASILVAFMLETIEFEAQGRDQDPRP